MTLAKAGLRSLAAATITSFGMVGAATAGIVEPTYDALIDVAYSFSLISGGVPVSPVSCPLCFVNTPGFPNLIESSTGSGEVNQDNEVLQSPTPGSPGVPPGYIASLFLEAFNNGGIGSSSATGEISFGVNPTFAQPGFVTGQAINVFLQIMALGTPQTTATFNNGNTGAIAISSFSFGGPQVLGGTLVNCQQAQPTAQDLSTTMCFEPSGPGPMVVTLTGTVSGSTSPAPVPEPASLALLGLGLAGLAASRRRKLN